MPIYLIDTDGALLFPIELPDVPGLGLQMPGNAVEVPETLPPAADGYVWVIEGETPVQKLDRRGTLFNTETGEPTEHASLGELPAGLTDIPRPTQFHRWIDGAWQEDRERQIKEQVEGERIWRDEAIRQTDSLVLRHRDELELKLATTLSKQQYQDLQDYRLLLRQWPQHGSFPCIAERPLAPDWLD